MKHYKTQKIRMHLLILAAALALGGCGISVDKRVERARTTMESGDYRAAMTDLKTALEREPANAEARALLAEVSAWFGDYESADKEVERALQAGATIERVRDIRYQSLLELRLVCKNLQRRQWKLGLDRHSFTRAIVSAHIEQRVDHCEKINGLGLSSLHPGKCEQVADDVQPPFCICRNLP